jgi:hypothetical protein
MWRLFFLGLIVWLAIYFLKQYIANIDSQKTNKTETASHDNIENGQTAEDMVQCAACKVHLPRSEAFLVANNFYCSKAHIKNK